MTRTRFIIFKREFFVIYDGLKLSRLIITRDTIIQVSKSELFTKS